VKKNLNEIDTGAWVEKHGDREYRTPETTATLRSLGSDRILQITTPISPGSSGCLVLDQSGNVVGVSFASIEKGQNPNFAVPSDYLVVLQAAKSELRHSRDFRYGDNLDVRG
jgi:S1-C subfamily serine protease